MAVQDPRLAGYGVRPLTDEETAARDARQAAYQQQLAQRQMQQAQRFQQTMQTGLANQAGREFVEPQQAPAISPAQQQAAGVAMQGVADRAVANALPPSPLLGVGGAASAGGMTNAQVLDQDRANLANLVSSQPTFVGPQAGQDTTLSPDILAQTNAGIARALQEGRQPASPARTPERGNYNMMNTDLQQLSQRSAQTNGINFGFGVNGSETARQYLDRMAVVDQGRSAERQRIQNNVERIALGREARSEDPFARRAARERMAELAASEAAGFDQANTARIGATQNATALEQARIQGQFGLAGEQVRGDFGLQQADLTGQYGVHSAMERAAGQIEAAQLNADPVKQARAAMLETRLRQLNAKIAAGTATDEDFLNFTATVGSPSEQLPVNPITGAPLSPQEVEAEQRRNLERLQQPR
jgi:hypothetical protein